MTDEEKLRARAKVFLHGSHDRLATEEFAKACYDLGKAAATKKDYEADYQEVMAQLRAIRHWAEPKTMVEAEKDAITRTMIACHGRALQAARVLQIGKTSLYRKIHQYQLEHLCRNQPKKPAPSSPRPKSDEASQP